MVVFAVEHQSDVAKMCNTNSMELYSGQNCQEVIRRKLSFWFNDIRFTWRICNVGNICNVAYLILTDILVVFFSCIS